jgi:RNA polymerase sigma-70 factor (ECF subfamily)
MEESQGRGPVVDKRAAFEETTLPLMGVVYQRALNLTRRADVAEDLVQETYLRAFRTFENFEPGSNAKAWLLTILYSVFVSRYRREKREPEPVSLEEADRTYATVVASEREHTPAVLNSKLWASGEVQAALDKVTEPLRMVLLMVDVDELSYEEAAKVLECPIGTIRSRLSRARQTMYVELRQYARERGFPGAQA